ncbi:MAG: hypothetical protein RhofKO_43110 [Rhodothermales bacterium]
MCSRKFGSTQDTELVMSILTTSEYSLKRKAASILLQLAPDLEQELALELLRFEDSDIHKITLRYFISKEDMLPFDFVRALLYRSSDATRLMALAYLAKKLSDEELKSLLRHYSLAEGFDFYYYDVICWLDRIVHAPTLIANWYKSTLNAQLEEHKSLLAWHL